MHPIERIFITCDTHINSRPSLDSSHQMIHFHDFILIANTIHILIIGIKTLVTITKKNSSYKGRSTPSTLTLQFIRITSYFSEVWQDQL